MRVLSGVLVLSGFALSGCKGQENGVFAVDKIDTWVQSPTDQVDILFVVDDSTSMVHEQERLIRGFDSFIDEIESTETDFHIGVITTSFLYDDPTRGVLIGSPQVLTRETPDYQDKFRERVAVGIEGSDKEKGLEAAAYALSTVVAAGPNAGFVREDAFLLIVFVSDEEDCSDHGALGDRPGQACYNDRDLLVPIGDFVTEFQALKPDPVKVQIGAIVGQPPAESLCTDSTNGKRYTRFAKDMGGLVSDICETDYSDIMYRLGLNATGVLASFQLSEPAKPDTIVVHVGTTEEDEVEVPNDASEGWTYDEETLFLTFHGASVPARGATISAEYTVEPGGDVPEE